MVRHRKKKKRLSGAVELNLAAMLDMAFQLLTFFILTFKPAPIEGEIALRMPQASPPVKTPNAQQLGQKDSTEAVASQDTVAISVLPDGSGRIKTVMFEADPIPFEALENRLRTSLSDPNSTLKQVVIQAGSGLHYDELMKVIDKCTRQKLANGEPLKKLSFVELPDGS
jgi:biopolymer transport protein ExbD